MNARLFWVVGYYGKFEGILQLQSGCWDHSMLAEWLQHPICIDEVHKKLLFHDSKYSNKPTLVSDYSFRNLALDYHKNGWRSDYIFSCVRKSKSTFAARAHTRLLRLQNNFITNTFFNALLWGGTFAVLCTLSNSQ